MTKYTISILTFNRINDLIKLLDSLNWVFNNNEVEIIVINNGSNDNTSSVIKQNYPQVVLIDLKKNIGIAARNYGLRTAAGKYIITLDDDLFGLKEEDLNKIEEIFTQNQIGTICFKVIDYYTKKLSNWCHPYAAETHQNKYFNTIDITEGAVVYKKDIFKDTGYYVEYFFISNEGFDLACRILDSGFRIVYTPEIILEHRHSKESRVSWRRYYYDTRNHFYITIRNFPLFFSIKYILSKQIPLLIYSLRDGFLKFYFKAYLDVLFNFRILIKDRNILKNETIDYIKKINKNKPGPLKLIRQRLLQKNIRL